MACRSCGGGRQRPPDANRGLIGHWSLRWPHGALQRMASEEAARAAAAARPDLNFEVLPPVEETP